MRLPPLPIDAVLPELLSVLEGGTRAVLQAPPGAGKTTRVPLALLEASWRGEGRIVMLEPRRLATRASARHMAQLLGEAVGGTVGYRVRGDSAVSRRTRVEVVTEGVLTRMLQDDPSLEGVAALLFDEYHERNLVADLGLALALHSAALVRPDLRIVVMSATLDGARVAALLDGAPIVTSEGRMFPVETIHVARREGQRLEGAVAAVIERALREQAGDVLVFLPGAAEIRRTSALLATRELPATVDLFSLQGTMPPEQQDRAIAPSIPGRRKVVLATSVAETSLTIEGVRVVVDSGVSRVPRFSPRTGMTRLETVRVARDSADQRRGRAGRVAPGVCYRCWDSADDAQLLAHRAPEILEADLAPLALELASAGISDAATLRWLDLPPAGAMRQARTVLAALGALDPKGRLTAHGTAMAAMGLHPRLAHLVIAAQARGAAADGCDLAALLADRDILRRDDAVSDPDLRTRLELLRRPNGGDDPRVERARWFQVRDEARRLRGEVGAKDRATDRATDRAHAPTREPPLDSDAAAMLAALAYPDRVALAREGSRGRFVMRNGGAARVDERSPLADAEALSITETDGAPGEARVYLAAPLTQRDLEALFADDIVREELVAYDAQHDTIRAVRRRTLGALVLEERALHAPDPALIGAAWIPVIRAAGLASLPWTDSASALRARVRFARTLDERWPDWSDAALLESIEHWLAPSLAGVMRRAALDRVDLYDALRTQLDWKQLADLDRVAPTHVEVPTGSRIAVDYADPLAPVLAVRLQELFGTNDTPRVGGGQVPLTLHLLSPAHRPVQVTRDLAGFWSGSYFAVRKDLRGRYPRHSWPEDPLHAEPTRRAKPR